MASGFTVAELQAQIPRLRRYARALTGSRERADDLTQDTLERAWNKRALWRADPALGACSLGAWLFAVMHNVFINGLRREGRFEPLDRVAEATDQPEAASAASVETPLALRDLERALDRLAPEQRAVLLLVALEGLAYDEAAAVLGVPIGTVMSRLSRARERLRRLLDPEEAVMPMRRVK